MDSIKSDLVVKSEFESVDDPLIYTVHSITHNESLDNKLFKTELETNQTELGKKVETELEPEMSSSGSSLMTNNMAEMSRRNLMMDAVSQSSGPEPKRQRRESGGSVTSSASSVPSLRASNMVALAKEGVLIVKGQKNVKRSDEVEEWVREGANVHQPETQFRGSNDMGGAGCSSQLTEVGVVSLLHPRVLDFDIFVEALDDDVEMQQPADQRCANTSRIVDCSSDDDSDIVFTQQQPSRLREIPADDGMDPSDATVINAIQQEIDENEDQMFGLDSHFDWVGDFTTFTGKAEDFNQQTGPTRNFETPFEAFVAIWDNEIISHIVTNTNDHAKSEMEKRTREATLGLKGRLRKWVDTSVNEIYTLLALFMYMGLWPLTSLNEFWKSPSQNVSVTGFRELMFKYRYDLLTRYLHFVNDSNQSDSDRKLFILRPIINHLNKKFQELYVPERFISLDESLSLWKGHLSWVQMIRTKAARFGIKTFEVCEASTGYLYRFEIYTGKTDGGSEEPLSDALAGKASKIVISLLQGLEKKGYCVVMDNFYNSPALARYLKSQGFDCFGTVRANRKHMPEDIKTVRPNVPLGTTVARHSGDVSVLAWKDSKVVNIISTYHTNSTYVGARAGKEILKPESVRDYNSGMGGVDLKDGKLSQYRIERKKSLKWTTKMFKRLLNVSIHNAYIMFNHCMRARDKPVLSHRSFRWRLADDIIRHYGQRDLFSQPPRNLAEQRLRKDLNHLPIKSSKRVRCVNCSTLGRRSETMVKCKACDRGLCLQVGDDNCFTKYHTLTNLKEQNVRE